MSRLDDWLAAMPPEDEVEASIEELEARLRTLRLIKQLRAGQPAATRQPVPEHAAEQNGNGSLTLMEADGESEQDPDIAAPGIDLVRFSRERRDILEAMLELPGHTARPAQVRDRLRSIGIEKGEAPIGTNMQRMARHGMLAKVAAGTYRVLPDAARIVRELALSDAEVVVE